MKLAAVLLVPALLAVGLGVVQIHDDVTRANSYADMQRLVKMRGELRTLLKALQMERTMSVERLSAADADAGAGDAHDTDAHDTDAHDTDAHDTDAHDTDAHDTDAADAADLRKQRQSVDSARTTVAHTRKQEVSLTDVAAHRYSDALGLMDRLPALRAQVTSGDVSSWSALNGYGKVITGVLDLDQALASGLQTPQLTRAATALYVLEAVEEQIHLEHAILAQAAGRGRSMTPTLTKALREADVRMRDRLADFRAVATPAELSEYKRTVTGPAVTRRADVVSTVLAQPLTSGTQQDAASLPVPADKWNRDSETAGNLVDKVSGGFLHKLRTSSAQAQDETSDRAGAASVILFAVLLLALTIGLGIGRHLLRSLTVLRSTALDVAENRLPAAVESMREGRKADGVVDVVPVHTTEEFGQLARAFDTVHAEAVRLAAEQAALRGDLRSTLVNLSRRSQSLVDRLLLMMEQLERHEEDPEQLASLFTLDHLATRMRRNNENMMVLCGSSLVRPAHGAALDTVLRGAVSEIEHYQRVLVQPSPAVDVVGYVAGDLGRLVAELLDNATTFSPPHTQVGIGGIRQADGSLLIEIQDGGIGMNESDLARANRRVATDTASDAPASRQLGLFVVGRLAGRHGIDVSLSSQPGVRGLRASVVVPAKLVTAQATAPSRTDQPGAVAGRRPAAALPTRTPGGRANGGRTDGGRTGGGQAGGGKADVGKADVGKASSGLPQRPVSGAAVTTRPAPGGRAAPQQPGGPSWFDHPASAASDHGANHGANHGAGNGANAQARRPAPEKPAPAPASASASASAPAARRPAGDGAREPGQPAGLTENGLPKRVPRTRPAPARTERPATATGAGDGNGYGNGNGNANRDGNGNGNEGAVSKNASRAHSFLSSYQSGIRRAQPDQTHNPSATGRETP
ncbi:hypothetical protein GCM10027091_43150 [Streptomyces daliensis]